MYEAVVQGSEEWKRIRVGKVTASRIADIVARTKSGFSASREKYAGELIAEILTGEPAERPFTSAAMQWGTDQESQARTAYEFMHDVGVVEVAFVDHPTISGSGASPDGLVGDSGLLEIKCPETHTHIETLIKQTIPAKYVTQMMWQMACTGRQWCDFVSYDPRLPESMQMFVRRVARDDVVIQGLETAVVEFLRDEVSSKVETLRKLYEQEAA
jgi:putative phage-type endonuclease